jgi:putative glutamine amidotransferase
MRTMKPRIGVTCSTMSPKEGGGIRRLQVPEAYVRRVEEAGGLPLILPIADPAWACDYLALVDGLLVIGGDDVDPALYGARPHRKLGPVDRARDEFEIALVRAAARTSLPTFGICRGVQVMNVALGGTLVQDVPDEVPGALRHGGRVDDEHGVVVTAGTRLAHVLDETVVRVNSHHHQAIAQPAPGFLVTARASDGVVEGAEIPEHPFFLGVQWHPERMDRSESTRRLFRRFVEASSTGR